MPKAWLVHHPLYLFPATSDVAGLQHKASWEVIVIVFNVFDMLNGVPPGWKITTHNQTIREKMTVCIARISNVNQLGSRSHCDVMARHLQGNRGGFSHAIYGFQDANFFKLNAWDKQRKPAGGFSVSLSPKGTFVIVPLFLYGVSRSSDPKSTSLLKKIYTAMTKHTEAVSLFESLLKLLLSSLTSLLCGHVRSLCLQLTFKVVT